MKGGVMPRPTELTGKAIGKAKGIKHGLSGHTGIMRKLAEEHGEVSALLSRCKKAETAADRRELFSKIRLELLAHAKAEQEIFYSRLKEFDATRELAEHGEDEHHEMEDMIDRLYTMGYEGDDWAELFEELDSSVRDHVKEEESEMFDGAEQVLTRNELEALATMYIAAKNQELVRLH
jgi:hypothetical protein